MTRLAAATLTAILLTAGVAAWPGRAQIAPQGKGPVDMTS
jgi:hypothetical protein